MLYSISRPEVSGLSKHHEFDDPRSVAEEIVRGYSAGSGFLKQPLAGCTIELKFSRHGRLWSEQFAIEEVEGELRVLTMCELVDLIADREGSQ